MMVLGFIRDLFLRFPLLLAGNILLLVLESLLGMAAIFSVAPMVDVVTNAAPGATSHITNRMVGLAGSLGLSATPGVFVAIFLTFQLLKYVLGVLARYSLLRTKYAVLRDIMLGTYEDLFSAQWLFFSSSQQGTLLNTFVREITVVGDAFGAMSLMFASVLQLMFYLAVPFFLAWKITAISLGFTLLCACPFLFLGKIYYRLGTLTTATANTIGRLIHEGFTLAKIIIGFGNQEKSAAALGRIYDAHSRAAVRSLSLAIATSLAYEPLGLIVLAVTVFAAKGFGTPISDLGVLLWAFRNSIPLVANVTSSRNSLANFFPSYEQVQALRRRARELKQRTGGTPFVGFRREIALSHLVFAYPDREPTLTDISARIPKGKMVALVGESGAGKSTLIDVIMGFHEPSAGSITFDHIPLQQFDITSYRKRIGYVPQDSVLFNMTIRENLRWAREDASDEQIQEACRLANAEEFIERLPEGYDTEVGDRGIRLSGGERQRIALARAILRAPDLLILDEATSSLDTQSERLIQQAIETIGKVTTVVVIAHRLSTITKADYVYVLHQGRIVEEGPYEVLICQDGHLRRMVQLQHLVTAAS